MPSECCMSPSSTAGVPGLSVVSECPDAGRVEDSELDVLIVTYHSGAVIDSCLDQVSAFVPPGSRIVVVDNSPSDPSAAEAADRHGGVQLLTQSHNVGFAAAVNAGLAHTFSALVMLVNPDVVDLEGNFDDVRGRFAENPVVGAITVRITDEEGVLLPCRREPRPSDIFLFALGGHDGVLARRLGVSDPMRRWSHDEERFVEQASGALLFLRRSALIDVGPFDEQFFMYWEETDWLARARARGWRLLFTPKVRAIHLGKKSSSTAESTYRLLLLETAYTYMRKHYGRSMTMLLRLVWLAADTGQLIRAAWRPTVRRPDLGRRILLHLGLYRTSHERRWPTSN